uniref:GIY-YIG endonuclease n=1 Tax=Parasitella parasitica TaxID=35722 RepID=A0A088S8G0_9FUNG|nr:GIY-YIG endonuclease [Parasitella parasitica]AIO05748.1 GIY-YIG endonuclease [Parasitella parasitica]
MFKKLKTLFSPAKYYDNFGQDKSNIILDNKSKSGIYILINRKNSSFYVGSSSNIARRMSSYSLFAYLNNPKNKNMVICKALLKYEHDSFALMILEYCDISELVQKEQYWIDVLSPDYNVLKYAYNSQGYKHTPESISLMSKLASLKVVSDETKEKISKSMIGENNHLYGKSHTAEILAKIALSKSHSSVFLYNEYKELMCIFSSLTTLAKLINSNNKSLQRYIESQDLFRGNWYITKELIKDSDIPLIVDHSTEEFKELIQSTIECKSIRKAIFVFNTEPVLLAKYDGVIDAEKALKISHETIKKYCKSGEIYNNRFIFSYHNLDLTD